MKKVKSTGGILLHKVGSKPSHKAYLHPYLIKHFNEQVKKGVLPPPSEAAKKKREENEEAYVRRRPNSEMTAAILKENPKLKAKIDAEKIAAGKKPTSTSKADVVANNYDIPRAPASSSLDDLLKYYRSLPKNSSEAKSALARYRAKARQLKHGKKAESDYSRLIDGLSDQQLMEHLDSIPLNEEDDGGPLGSLMVDLADAGFSPVVEDDTLFIFASYPEDQTDWQDDPVLLVIEEMIDGDLEWDFGIDDEELPVWTAAVSLED